ncbi:unnamed protein product [Colias eurytheme]|nr:unnamed protein product [Colias eurytheme]
MRVKSATQLFSHSVAVVTEHLTATGDLNEECRQLVDFTLLMDNLFDSMNDPVENFFGNIRSYGARNIAPNTMAFEGAFKALLLNNFSSPHSRRANCEEDSNECLQT